VLYRLAEPGEVLAAGGKALTLVNLDDIYMEIFLPSEQAAAVKVGAEGRVTVDYDPRAIAGQVSFVSPEAQFTPKQVETKSEREKLMFRVKIPATRRRSSASTSSASRPASAASATLKVKDSGGVARAPSEPGADVAPGRGFAVGVTVGTIDGVRRVRRSTGRQRP
jgi:hypothetical protein